MSLMLTKFQDDKKLVTISSNVEMKQECINFFFFFFFGLLNYKFLDVQNLNLYYEMISTNFPNKQKLSIGQKMYGIDNTMGFI